MANPALRTSWRLTWAAGPLGALALVALSAAACSAGDAGVAPRDRMDGGTAPGEDAGTTGPTDQCESFLDCPEGQVCRPVGPLLRCVPPDMPPPGGGCMPACTGLAECRLGVCIAPDDDGAVCEFDPECGAGSLCIAGRCTPDPRRPIPCAADGTCSGTLTCEGSRCVCRVHVDCPVGTLCMGGSCIPDTDGCVADDECPADTLCEGGACRPRTACDIVPPDLTGPWSMRSVLRLRESLPRWLDGFLRAVSGPFRFIAGDADRLEVGLPDWVEDLIAPAMRDWADANLAPWVRDLLGGIADLNDILSTWNLEERMELRPGVLRSFYKGTHEWQTIQFRFRGMDVRGRPEDILDWRFRAAEFDAAVTCGVFVIERHDIDVSIGAIIAWVVNTVTYEATGRRYRTLREALTAATGGLCTQLGRVAGEAAPSYPGVASTVTSACNTAVSRLLDELDRTLREGRLGLDVMTLKGSSPIAGPNTLRPGGWEGTLLGRDFTGDFEATR